MLIKLKRRAMTLREAFGEGFPTDQNVEGHEPSDSAFVPEPDPEWMWDRRTLRDLVIWWMCPPDPLYLFGPTGAGKSAAIRNFCAALNIPLYERTIYEGLEFSEVLTVTDLIDGTTVTSYGLLPLAMGVHGYPGIFNADDVDRGDPAFLSGFYEVLEGQPVTTNVGGADIVKPTRGFRITATGNTALLGDQLGVYQGTKPQDIAFGDRFFKMEVQYMQKRQEKSLLRRIAPKLAKELTDAMVEVANEFRDGFMGNSSANSALPFPMSTRSLIRWARLTYAYRGSKTAVYDALDRAFLNGANDDRAARMAMEKIAKGKLGPAFEQHTAQPA